MTVAGTQTFSKASVLTSNPEQGGQYVNIRNLGEQRTLVLVNGKRWATSLAGFTDLSTIPSSLIERIDVLKDGASAIYGSDAIAGVVNIILQESFSGAEASGYYGQNQAGDGVPGGLLVHHGHQRRKELADLWRQRQQGRRDLGRQAQCHALQLRPEPYRRWPERHRSVGSLSRYGQCRHGGTAGRQPWCINHTGTYDGIGVGANSRDPANYHVGTNDGNDYYNPPRARCSWAVATN